jgi:lysophospholipase L1-like esterase
MLALLAVLDAAFRALWHPHPIRLPEQFSPAYLNDYVAAARDERPIVVLGDSALWGYHLTARESAVAQLAALEPQRRFLNLSYEGGSIVNSLIALRLAEARGVHPAAVIVNLNSKEFNPADSAYNRLHPSLERAAGTLLTAHDRALLAMLPPPTFADRLNAAVERVWALYRARVDIRVAIFGVDDAAGALTAALQQITGERARDDRLHRPTAAAYTGTYDLETPGPDNVEAIALRELRDELVRDRIPTIAFLTPTNHVLLRDVTDDPAYAANLHTIAAAMRGPGIDVVDWDALAVGPHFIDNDHLDASGSRTLAEHLAHELAAIHQ